MEEVVWVILRFLELKKNEISNMKRKILNENIFSALKLLFKVILEGKLKKFSTPGRKYPLPAGLSGLPGPPKWPKT